MRCSECGFENPTNMKFCGQCGTALASACPKCQFLNPSGFKYCGQCATQLLDVTKTQDQSNGANAPSNSTSDANISSVAQQAERRQITVLFCDVVGSSQLSEVVDPEDLRDIMREYRNTCDTVIKHYNGYIAQYLGDGILAYYGFPTAHEADARNAVVAAYELIRSMKILNNTLLVDKGITLDIRLGIHTGLVVIGEIGGGDKRTTALGETPNIAARLQDLAKPNCIVISSATYQLVGHYVNSIALGEHHLKGFSRSFKLYQVINPINFFHHIDNNKQIHAPPLIGREQESNLLLDRIEQANVGHGQVVLLRGEAGIGKSRLVQYLRDGKLPKPYYLIESWGSQYYKNSYLFSIIEALKYLLNLDQLENDIAKLSRIETTLESFGIPLEDNVPILASLLSIPITGQNYEVMNYTPAQLNQKTLEVLLTIIISMASQRLVVIIIEDLHWIDQTTLDLIGLLIDQVPTARIYMLLTYRVDFTPPWPNQTHLTQITVNRLTRDQTGEMIKWLTSSKKLPQEVFEEIVNKTDGIPFFVDELTKMVLGSTMLKEFGDHYKLCAPLSSMSIPSTLQDSLMAKLDKLGPNKALAQLSATLGREFGHSLLKALVSSDPDKFEKQISHLVCDELLYQRGLPPNASYTFRHTLVQELAYQSLLKKTRQKYHRLIASTLVNQFPERSKEHPEILAHHCYEAGDNTEAIKQLINAGKLAILRSALLDASVHLNTALSYTIELSESITKLEFELAIQSLLGLTCMLYKGYGAKEVQIAYERAHQLCKNIGKTASLFPVLAGLWEYYVVRGDMNTAFEIATQLKEIESQITDSHLSREQQRIMGSTLFWRGKISEASECLQSDYKLDFKEQNNLALNQVYCQNSEVARLANLACVLWLQGYPEKAIDNCQLALDVALKLDHPFSIAYALNFNAIVHQLCGNIDNVEESTNKLLTISNSFEFRFWQCIGNVLSSWAALQKENNKNDFGRLQKNIDDYESAGSCIALPYFNALLIQTYLDADQNLKALQLVKRSIDRAVNQNQLFFSAELHRLHAKVLLSLDKNDTDAVDETLLTAINTAKKQNALTLEIRATVDYCRFLHSTSKSNEAFLSLSALFERFDELPINPDSQNARLLLDELQNSQSCSLPTGHSTYR